MGLPVDTSVAYLIEGYGTTQTWREFPHTGDDWARKKVGGVAVTEYPDVFAVHSGTVLEARFYGNAGNRIIIKYWFGRFGVYGHLHRIDVKAGQTVKEADKIGLLGGSGKVTGPHLHYSQYNNQARAVSGIVPYWKGVKWASVDAWASSFGLLKPTYTTRKDDPIKGADNSVTIDTSKGQDMMLALINVEGKDYFTNGRGYELVKDENDRIQLEAGIKAVRAAMDRGDVTVRLGKYNGRKLLQYLDALAK